MRRNEPETQTRQCRNHLEDQGEREKREGRGHGKKEEAVLAKPEERICIQEKETEGGARRGKGGRRQTLSQQK